MSPKHTNEDCTGAWQYNPKEQWVGCSKCGIRYKIDPKVWAEVQADHALRNVLVLATRDGQRMLEGEKKGWSPEDE